jgi:hypothetical protein
MNTYRIILPGLWIQIPSEPDFLRLVGFGSGSGIIFPAILFLKVENYFVENIHRVDNFKEI